MLLEPAELIIRVLIAGGLGALVGLDRELADQPAGLRTHVLVSLGAALFTLTGAYGVSSFTVDPGTPVDPTRVAAQVVTGIGFLGAGAIIRQGFSVRGLTTAAGLWVTAAIGTAVALGFYIGALATTGSAVVALYALKRVERLLLRRLKPGRWEFIIETESEIRLSNLTNTLERNRASVESIRMDTTETGGRDVVMELLLPPRSDPQDFAEMLRSLDGVRSVDWSR
ncbi:MAG: MgtC/SapB family protein [Actinobacteria bacterium]|nr:MgtC/SapB family protein [Actinomycetota bacterium]